MADAENTPEARELKRELTQRERAKQESIARAIESRRGALKAKLGQPVRCWCCGKVGAGPADVHEGLELIHAGTAGYLVCHDCKQAARP